MAEDKRIRIAADTTPLRQLREEAVSLYREINQASMQSAQEAEKSIAQLREQLALMEDRNELERLLLDLKRQSAAIDATTMQKPSPMPERPIRRQPPTEELPRPEQPIIDPRNRVYYMGRIAKKKRGNRTAGTKTERAKTGNGNGCRRTFAYRRTGRKTSAQKKEKKSPGTHTGRGTYHR